MTNVLVSAKTDVGRKREHNEDNFYCVRFNEQTGSGFDGVFVVADGMGGHAKGEVASAEAVRYFSRIFNETKPTAYQDYCQEFGLNPEERRQNLKQMISQINDRIYRLATRDSDDDAGHMGTTLTVAGIIGNQLYLAHVGDSRLYLIRDHQIIQLSTDHTLVAEQVRSGNMTDEEALQSKHKNVLTQAVGFQHDVEVQAQKYDLQPGDMLVLCSDGLWGMVSDQQILASVIGQFPKKSCEDLVDLANEQGGKDNITAVVVHYQVEHQGQSADPKSTKTRSSQQALPASKKAHVTARSGLKWQAALAAGLGVLLLVGGFLMTPWSPFAWKKEQLHEQPASSNKPSNAPASSVRPSANSNQTVTDAEEALKKNDERKEEAKQEAERKRRADEAKRQAERNRAANQRQQAERRRVPVQERSRPQSRGYNSSGNQSRSTSTTGLKPEKKSLEIGRDRPKSVRR